MQHSHRLGSIHTTMEPVRRVWLRLAYQGILFCEPIYRTDLLIAKPSMAGRKHTRPQAQTSPPVLRSSTAVSLSASRVSLGTVLRVLSKELRVSCSPPIQRQLCHSQGKGEPWVPPGVSTTIIHFQDTAEASQALRETGAGSVSGHEPRAKTRED